MARALRIAGDNKARRLAEQIEQVCRAAESHVAGATPLNPDAPRYSGDIDVFHDREERVASAALSDAQALKAAGTRLEWVVDSDFRFSRPCAMRLSVTSYSG